MPARILLIEDNPANLDLTSYLLRAYGYFVIAATDGGDGLATARREKPNLIVCDVQLPTMDGFEVARWLKLDPAMRGTPLIAVTALAMVGDRNRVLAAGFDEYIAKPIDPEAFVRQVDAFLPSNRHRPAPMPNAAGIISPQKPLTRHHSILVVDNLAVNLELARGILEPYGYEVVTADGMSQALILARQQPFDLILSDVCMADGANGFDFLRAVQADSQLTIIPVVLITSTMLTENDRSRGLALGAARYLMRPIDPAILLAEIEGCLRQKNRT
jgi:two-component system cell cycle response regulator